MEILTFPVGIVVGAITVAVSLGEVPRGELRLDGAPVCAVTVPLGACDVDLGPAPRVHLLELVNAAKPAERVQRWVNRPGSGEAEVRVRERCPGEGESCTIEIATVHPDGAAPQEMRVLLDGKSLAKRLVPSVRVPRPKEGSVRVLVVEALFPDGRKATTVRVMGRHGLSDETGASLQAVPVEPVAPEADAGALPPVSRLGALPVHAVEEGGSEAVFVIDPSSYSAAWALNREILGRSNTSRIGGELPVLTPVAARLADEAARPGDMTFVDPRAKGRFARITPSSLRLGRLSRLLWGPGVHLIDPPRIADAVAAAGMYAASSQRRRAVVLLLAGGPDNSRFSPAAVISYLSSIMVPLHVWRLAAGKADGWGSGVRVASVDDLESALRAVNRALDRQRLAWLDGELGPDDVRGSEGETVRIAGR